MTLLTKEQLAELRQFDAPTICNALEAFNIQPRTAGFMKPGMMLRLPLEKPMIGYAATAKVAATVPGGPNAGENMIAYYETVRDMADPTIAVIQDIDKEPIGSFWGEVQVTTHKALGCVGTLTEGGVRDLDAVEEIGFGYFSTQIHVSHAYVHVEQYNCPVNMLGLTIRPGDLLFADRHGVVLIPDEIAPKLAKACQAIADAELPMLEPCRAAIKSGVKPTTEELRAWRKAMDTARKAVKLD